VTLNGHRVIARRGEEVSTPQTDGRLRRSERSRQVIVEAMVELVGEGVLEPTAEQVAERAEVGLRTVFRHFRDMEGLYAAMDARLQARVAPLLDSESPTGALAARVAGLVAQRAELFEAVAPYKRAEVLKRWRSEFLRSRHAGMVRRLRTDLRRWLPETAEAPAELADALELVTSFEAWDRLRSEQRLGRSRAAAVVEQNVLALLRGLRS
jgi:AcrR family transcriptional regulator